VLFGSRSVEQHAFLFGKVGAREKKMAWRDDGYAEMSALGDFANSLKKRQNKWDLAFVVRRINRGQP